MKTLRIFVLAATLALVLVVGTGLAVAQTSPPPNTSEVSTEVGGITQDPGDPGTAVGGATESTSTLPVTGGQLALLVVVGSAVLVLGVVLARVGRTRAARQA